MKSHCADDARLQGSVAAVAVDKYGVIAVVEAQIVDEDTHLIVKRPCADFESFVCTCSN